MANNNKKNRINIVYSTNENFSYEQENEAEQETLPKNQQKLRVRIEKNQRGGKTVTVVAGFVGSLDDINALGKILKTKCGVGGNAKDGEILIQGEFKDKVIAILISEGYTGTK